MPKPPCPTFIVQPQRSDGRAYVLCDLHRATSFAVVRIDKVHRHGKVYTVTKVIERCPTRNQAESLAEANRRSFAPEPKHLIRKLGRRIFSE
jgi:hypothetical protein